VQNSQKLAKLSRILTVSGEIALDATAAGSGVAGGVKGYYDSKALDAQADAKEILKFILKLQQQLKDEQDRIKELIEQMQANVSIVLEKPLVYFGKTYDNLFKFVREKFFDANLSLNVLLSILERSVAPMFEQFMEMDLKSGEINKATHPVDINGEDMDPGQIKDLIKQIKDANAPASDKATLKEQGRFSEGMKSRGFSEAVDLTAFFGTDNHRGTRG